MAANPPEVDSAQVVALRKELEDLRLCLSQSEVVPPPGGPASEPPQRSPAVQTLIDFRANHQPAPSSAGGRGETLPPRCADEYCEGEGQGGWELARKAS